jgi:o-succinylbenzoate---CoA ligase
MTHNQTTRIPCLLATASKHFAAASAILTEHSVLSYAELEAVVSAVSLRLKKEGIYRGQRIAIVSWNSWEYVALLFAIMRLGAVACPMSPRFPRQTVLSIIQKIDCTTVIDGVNMLASPQAEILRTISPAVLFETAEISQDKKTKGQKQCIESSPDSHAAFEPEQPATIVLTSGTTSVPKAVLHSYANHYYNALGANENMPIHPGCRWLLSLPLFHVGGLGIVFRTFLDGGTIVVPAAKQAISVSLLKFGITHLSLVATQLYRLLEENVDEHLFRQLQAVLVGGGPVPASVLHRAQKAGIPLHTTYGLTEMASQVATTAPNAPAEVLKTSGRVLPYRRMMVKGDEICVKGETLFKGYVEGQNTRCPLDDEGWFQTGDLGAMNDQGYLTWHGRRDNMFVSGGENICPEEIERCLCLLPEISRAVVVPVEDAEFGFRPVAFVQSFDNRHKKTEKWMDHLEKHLPKFKLPEAFYDWPKQHNESTLKPDRRIFEQQAKKLFTRAR